MDLFIGDINNKVGIDGALVVVLGNESQPINSTSSDAAGAASLWLNETLTYYTVTYSKGGYHTQTSNHSWITPATDTIYLYPISDDGIIRIRFTDMTLNDRGYCIYFESNNRLEGCYGINDTAQVLVNQQYIVRPEIDIIDVLSSEQSITDNAMMFGGLIMAAGVVIFFAGIGVLLFLKISGLKR